MGQQSSSYIAPGSNERQQSHEAMRRVLPFYIPLVETVKPGDVVSALQVSSEEQTDVISKLLEFDACLRVLPKEEDVVASLQCSSLEKQVVDITRSVDTVDELFQQLSDLTSFTVDPSTQQGGLSHKVCKLELHEESPSEFDARIGAYVRNLKTLYTATKKEKLRYEQRQQAARAQAILQRKMSPPPLPLPTQNCLTVAWDMLIYLLRSSRCQNPTNYLHALKMLNDRLQSLKPSAYSDGMYLSPSASASFNQLADCLCDIVQTQADSLSTVEETKLIAKTIESLLELGLARGSLSILLYTVHWLLDTNPETLVEVDSSLSKLSNLKELPLYGKLVTSDELYCCGQNSYGELGLGDDIERHQLTSVPLCGYDVRQIASGNETLAVLTTDGTILTCGLNKSGQCGQGHFDERVLLLRPVTALHSHRIKFVAASNGCEHMIAITETGTAFSWGYNDRGQLGHDNLNTKLHIPKLIESMENKRISHAAVSYHHSALVTEEGALYTFGMNDSGQLGLDTTQHCSVPQLVKLLTGSAVSMVACGLYHTIICTVTGELYTCGKNDYGQLGIGHSRNVRVPTPVQSTNEAFCYVACGYYHSVVTTTAGRAFAFGRNDYGQLGIGNKTHQNIPNKIALPANIYVSRAACGCYHTVLLSEAGQVFTFGRNNKGQLGNRAHSDSLLPVQLRVRPETNSRRCVDIAAGFYTTALVVESNGENDEHLLSRAYHNSLVAICGKVDIDCSGEIEGLSNFGSISTTGIKLFYGIWFYEVEVVTCGLIQIGWIDGRFQGSSDQGEGVGDHHHSWSYDGNRQRRWNSGSSSYGEKWKAGDIIGCLLDLDLGCISFFKNGISLGPAFDSIRPTTADQLSGLMPGISLERGEIIRVNLGNQPFAYPPTEIIENNSILHAMKYSPSHAVISTLKPEDSNSTQLKVYPPELNGSASVLINGKLFVIGGKPKIDLSMEDASDVEATNQVWVFYTDTLSWERWTDFPIGVCHHQAVAIGDEYILVLGGEITTPTSRHMDLYKCFTKKNDDGSLPSWELITCVIGTGGTLPTARAYHSACTVRVRLDSLVFLFGGKSANDEILGDTWCLSLDDNSWSRLPTMMSMDPGPRIGCTVASIGENVYLFGGRDKENICRADLWRYNTFDRLWCLCHDDNVTNNSEPLVATQLSRDFKPLVPDCRWNYSASADLGNIWVYGGLGATGEVLKDLWCFSIASQKWRVIDITSSDSNEGCHSSHLMQATVLLGTLGTSNSSLDTKQTMSQVDSAMILWGGKMKINGRMVIDKSIRRITIKNTFSYSANGFSKCQSITAKSSFTILRELQHKTEYNTLDENPKHCLPYALDSAICILAHLDRLTSTSVIPANENDAVQLSQCSYKSLCVSPEAKTFENLRDLLEILLPKFLGISSSDTNTSMKQINNSVLYPILVILRLLKFNFFEMSRLYLEAPEIESQGLAHAIPHVFTRIREQLFAIADHTLNNQFNSKEFQLLSFYSLIKSEAAATIYYGFTVCFPSIEDRIRVINRLMLKYEEKSALQTEANVSMLIDMLIPSFTSARSYFELLNAGPILFTGEESSVRSRVDCLTQFMTTLINAEWNQTSKLLNLLADSHLSQHSICFLQDEVSKFELSHSFKCLNIMCRVLLLWCSEFDEGWVITHDVILRLIAYMGKLLDHQISTRSSDISQILAFTFPGNFLPFILIGVLSLPRIRSAISSHLQTIWPRMNELMIKLKVQSDKIVNLTAKVEDKLKKNTHINPISQLEEYSFHKADSTAILSTELSDVLGLQSGIAVDCVQVWEHLWLKIVSSYSPQTKGSTKLVYTNHNDIYIYRFPVSGALQNVLGTSYLPLVFQKQLAEDMDFSTIDIKNNAHIFKFSRTILSQHIFTVITESNAGTEPRSYHIAHEDIESTDISSTYPPIPPDNTLNISEAKVNMDWLSDFQCILGWIGSHYAYFLVVEDNSQDPVIPESRWLKSHLFRGGLVDDYPEDLSLLNNDPPVDEAQHTQHRNHILLQQIVQNTDVGKKLLDKVRSVVDSSTGGKKNNFAVTRLRRQDSVEAALEKSGGFESVDRAVRATFAVMLRHSNAFYMMDPVSMEGTLPETVTDAWRSALQVRRWIVREQQKLSATFSDDETIIINSAKDRQQVLYQAVCDPIVRRAQLLLEVCPAPAVVSHDKTPYLKLLPGLSAAPSTSYSKSQGVGGLVQKSIDGSEVVVKNLKLLMNTKSLEIIEQEDEQAQVDIFSFLQQSHHYSELAALSNDNTTLSAESQMRTILLSQKERASRRLNGLRIFLQLLKHTESIPYSRLNIVPTLACAFKRSIFKMSSNGVCDVAGNTYTIKVHYLENLELASTKKAKEISETFFTILENLLQSSVGALKNVLQVFNAKISDENACLVGSWYENTIHISRFVRELILVLDIACLPYKENDWEYLYNTHFSTLLMTLTEWKFWKNTAQFNRSGAAKVNNNIKSNIPIILPAASGGKFANVKCSREIAMSTDLQNLILTHKASSQVSSLGSTGVAVYNRVFNAGRWYCEVVIRSCSQYPVFIGLTAGTMDLNNFNENETVGANVYVKSSIEISHSDILKKHSNCFIVDTLTRIGVVLDFHQKEIVFYVENSVVYSSTFANQLSNFMVGCYPTICLCESEVEWDLMASIPPKIYASNNDSALSSFNECALLATSYEGYHICWNTKLVYKHLKFGMNGKTIVAPDVDELDHNIYETAVGIRGFDRNSSIYVECEVLSGGTTGSGTLVFGIVDEYFHNYEKCLSSPAVISWLPFETPHIGALYDFKSYCITTYIDHEVHTTVQMDPSLQTNSLLYPAMSVLCNGLIIDANFHARKGPGISQESLIPALQPPGDRKCKVERSHYKTLLLIPILSDLGKNCAAHSTANYMVGDKAMLSTSKCNTIILKHEVNTPFSVTHMTFRSSETGINIPARRAIVFITSSLPTLDKFSIYDSLTPEEFICIPFPPINEHTSRDEYLPVAYFVFESNSCEVSVALNLPIVGRYILLKFLAEDNSVKFDVRNVAFYGDFSLENGPAYMINFDSGKNLAKCASHCHFCNSIPYDQIFYTNADSNHSMCSTCYDDLRGNIYEEFRVSTQSNFGSELLQKCTSRRQWREVLFGQQRLSTYTLQGDGRDRKKKTDDSALQTSLHNINQPEENGFHSCEMFSCGQNNYGELCLGHCNSNNKLEHVSSFSMKSVRSIVGGNEVLAIVMTNGEVYTCGLNKSGQCGNGTFDERVIVAAPIRALSGISIDMIAAANGCEHMLAIAADGSVFSWGFNDRGQLGLGSTISKSHTPRLIESIRDRYHIVYGAVSYHHSAIVASTGEVLTFGMNDCGQLGLDSTLHHHTPQLIESMTGIVGSKVACGLYHTCILTKGGQVYTTGKNDYGQLGLGHTRNTKAPTLLKISASAEAQDDEIIEICCGYYHTVAVNNKGKVLTWGRNDYGQLGIGSKDHKGAPHVVPLPISSKAKKISCGCYHTMALLSNGRVMVFGRNNKGQLGTGSRTLPSADLPLPIPMNPLSTDEIVAIAAGFYSSYIMTGKCGSDIDRSVDAFGDIKDQPEHSSLMNSKALYESLMTEMDNQTQFLLQNPSDCESLNTKTSTISYMNLNYKKLQSAGWIATRSIIYQSLRCKPNRSIGISTICEINPVLRQLVQCLIENLKQVEIELRQTSKSQNTHDKNQRGLSIASACVGLIKGCLPIESAGEKGACLPFSPSQPHLYRNQLLWVLLLCGSVNHGVSKILADDADILIQIIKGIKSTDLATATISIRIAMIVFPMHSISYVNRLYRSIKAQKADDILADLMLLIGEPHILRPKLCEHEIGFETSATAICSQSRCTKGISFVQGTLNIQEKASETMGLAHSAVAKSAELIAFIRYMTLFPTWKIGVNAAISRIFEKSNKLEFLLDEAFAYFQPIAADTYSYSNELVDPNATSEKKDVVIRDPNTAESKINPAKRINVMSTRQAKVEEASTKIYDAIDSDHFQKSTDSLNSLIMLVAAVCVLGGHTETFREGGCAVFNDDKMHGATKTGVIIDIFLDNRKELIAKMRMISEEHNSNPAAFYDTSEIINVPLCNVHPVETVPATIKMFNNIENLFDSLTSIIPLNGSEIKKASKGSASRGLCLDDVIYKKLIGIRMQIQWRASKAICTLLEQIPILESPFSDVAYSLIDILTVMLSSENWLGESGIFVRLRNVLQQGGSGAEILTSLHNRWTGLKQKQMYFEIDTLVNNTLDDLENVTREKVIEKMGRENALKWGLDAIQSPRKSGNYSSFTGCGLKSIPRTGNSTDSDLGNDHIFNNCPVGTWGVLKPLTTMSQHQGQDGVITLPPPNIEFAPYFISTQLLRVGRAAEGCDLVVNDRSVSGRHFHLRRVNRSVNSSNTIGNEYYELQDFSKNGTIVNGVRVHGTSVRVTNGSRISLILSRGNLITYEFQLRSQICNTGDSFTHDNLVQQSEHQYTGLQVQIPGIDVNEASTAFMQPHSPAELQNHGGSRMTVVNPSETRRLSHSAQALRIVTSLTESDVPQALLSPNPAIESPRAGTFSSPRSSVLLNPGTPTAHSTTVQIYNNTITPPLLSPASYQQRESIASQEILYPIQDDTWAFEDIQSMARCISNSNITSLHESAPTIVPHEESTSTKLIDPEFHIAEKDMLDKRLTHELNTVDEKFTSKKEQSYSSNVYHLASILGKSPALCAIALQHAGNQLETALSLILQWSGTLQEEEIMEKFRNQCEIISSDISHSGQSNLIGNDSMLTFHDLAEENMTYKLQDSSSIQNPNLRMNRPESPRRKINLAQDWKSNQFNNSSLSIWWLCNSEFDDSINAMARYAVDQAIYETAEILNAVYMRKILNHLMRLIPSVPDSTNVDATSPLFVFNDIRVLRRIISFVGVSKSIITEKNCDKRSLHSDDGRIQNILSRNSAEAFNSATTNTLNANLNTLRNLSRVCLSIQQSDPSMYFGIKGLERLVQILLAEETKTLDIRDHRDPNVLHKILIDMLMHVVSRTHVFYPETSMPWEATPTKASRNSHNIFPKGPVNLSCGLKAILVKGYDRIWSIPSPDPLIKYRHHWRKRTNTSSEAYSRSITDQPATLWRPILPAALKSVVGKNWFHLGDVAHVGNDEPDFPVILVCDEDNDLLSPPVGYERVDVSGNGLPKNSNEDVAFQKKQLRSLWWPIPPPGYVSLGCVAGNREDAEETPHLSSTRCVRADLVRHSQNLNCIWKWMQFIHQTDATKIDTNLSNYLCEQVTTSLWLIKSEFSRTIIPVLATGNNQARLEANSEVVGFELDFSEEDKILCASVDITNILVHIDVLLACSTHENSSTTQKKIIRSELAASIFALVKQVLWEKSPASGSLAVQLIRRLVQVIQYGGMWQSKADHLYCRSKIMTLNRDMEGCGMLTSLAQSLIELMLAAHEQRRKEQIAELQACFANDSMFSTPYQFCLSNSFDNCFEMLVSHSAKLTVTRHKISTENIDERKFILEYKLDNKLESNSDLTEAAGGRNPNFFHSCRFEHTPAIAMTMNGKIKAEVIYYEVTVMEVPSSYSNTTGTIALGYSTSEFPLDDPCVGIAVNRTNARNPLSYAYCPVSGKVQCTDAKVDYWPWGGSNVNEYTISSGEVFGCGLRLDNQEMFFTKNGHLLGIAFSSINNPHKLHPTISFSMPCKLLINFASLNSDQEYPISDAPFTYRFGSMDWDNLMTSFEWFEQLTQVYGIMKSLLNKNTLAAGVSELPSEFLLSSDNFLSEISRDVCIQVESEHPYDLELKEALISIPLATSIRVKLDPRCETGVSHCLQILQGRPNLEGGESEVRVFTGACGAQEVIIDGESFIWRFPIQSNFQCRVDRIRKGPYLKLENSDTKLSLTRDKGWQAAIGVARFDYGVHIWEVRISFVTASSNIFLGVAKKDVRLDSYLGKDNRGWGWIGNRALWHNGSKQRGTYGEKFKTGDIVRMTLDLKRGTLSYALNGKDLGIAFGPGGTGGKLEGTFYPGFALYNQRDSIDLLGGHRMEESSIENSNGRNSHNLESELNEEDIVAEAIDEISSSSRSPSLNIPIPGYRMELIGTITQMGFPLNWCEFALRHCDDDAEQAADYILTNMHLMDNLLREEVEMSRRNSQRVDQSVESVINLDSEDSWLRPSEELNAVSLQSQTDNGVELRNSHITVKEGISAENEEKWGISFTSIPEFTLTGRRLLSIKYSDKLSKLCQSQTRFSLEHDHAIVELVNDICESRGESLLPCDPLRMSPNDFSPSAEKLRQYQCLQDFSLEDLQSRFLVLRNFNCRLQNSLTFIDLSIKDQYSLLARGARYLRGLIFYHVKLAWWVNIIKEQHCPAAARPEIEVDRHWARDATIESGMKSSVFAQCFDQLHELQPSLLRGSDRAFKCQFVGEFGDDFGGLYRECLAQISSELQSKVPVLPLLQPCPNAISGTGLNRDMFVLNSSKIGCAQNDSRILQMTEFLGKLMGVAVRTKTPLDLNIPSVIWKSLVNSPVTRSDIEAIHKGCFQVVDTIKSIEDHGITSAMFEEIIDATFTVLSSDYNVEELVLGGRNMRVSWNDKDAYAELVEKYRLKEFDVPCWAMRRGMATILPVYTLDIFTWKELSTLVCGKPMVDIDLLRRRSIYGDGCQASDPHIQYFWEVLREFSEEQKASFLRFAWGRSRLPTQAADFTQDFKISGLPKSMGRADMYLPIAHTCFFSIDLPMYSSKVVMREKLLYAITHCLAIDADNTTVAQRAGQGVNWGVSTSNHTTTATATATSTVASVIAGITGVGQ